MFKTYFTRDKNLLRSLLKTFLPLPSDKDIKSIQILNPEIPPETEKKKQIILDLTAIALPKYWYGLFNMS